MSEQLNFREHDRLDREQLANQLTKLITNSEELFDGNKSLSIAIDSPWGTGKSTFLEMWKNKLLEMEDERLKVVTYNAWYDDDFSIPLIPIIHELNELCSDENQRESFKNISLLLAKQIGKAVITKGIEQFLGLKLETLITTLSENTGVDLTSLKQIASSKEENNYFNEYKQYKEIKDKFKDVLNKVAEQKKIIFLIDELDRCRPTYAIETLETIKHLFDTKNLIFIIAIDMEQLKHSISTIYGANMDSYGYLRRFFDFNIRIPSPSVSKYINYIDNGNVLGNDKIKEEVAKVFVGLSLTLRDINVIFTNFRVVLITKLTNIEVNKMTQIVTYMYLIALKHKNPVIYKILLSGDFDIKGNSVENTETRFQLSAEYYAFSDIIKRVVNIMKLKGAQRKFSALRAAGTDEYTDLFKTILIDDNVDENINISNYIEATLEVIVDG